MNTLSTQQSSRLLSLDILRGITIAGMILVNNPGSWSSVYEPLRHADWHGLTPTDLVFPFFMFIMGVSTFMSLRKFNFEPSQKAVWKIIRRISKLPNCSFIAVKAAFRSGSDNTGVRIKTFGAASTASPLTAS